MQRLQDFYYWYPTFSIVGGSVREVVWHLNWRLLSNKSLRCWRASKIPQKFDVTVKILIFAKRWSQFEGRKFIDLTTWFLIPIGYRFDKSPRCHGYLARPGVRIDQCSFQHSRVRYQLSISLLSNMEIRGRVSFLFVSANLISVRWRHSDRTVVTIETCHNPMHRSEFADSSIASNLTCELNVVDCKTGCRWGLCLTSLIDEFRAEFRREIFARVWPPTCNQLPSFVAGASGVPTFALKAS